MKFVHLVLLGSAAGILTIVGCSLLGLGIGAISDASKPELSIIAGWQAETIKPGDVVGLTLKGGSHVSGKFVGLDYVPENEYAQTFARYQEQNAEARKLPAIGDSVTLTIKPLDKTVPPKPGGGNLWGLRIRISYCNQRETKL